MNKRVILILFALSLILILTGIMFRVVNWPFGKELQYIGLGTAFLTIIAYITKVVKSYLKSSK